jgi:hypothetical protein
MANRSVPALVLSDEDREILTTWSRSRTLPMNQVETWFSILQRQAIQRGVFGSVRALMGAIRTFLAHWDQTKHPFV